MSNRIFAHVALIICCPVFLISVSRFDQQVSTDAHDAIVRLEEKWLNAEEDPDALQSILADDFIHVLPLGFVTKDEQLKYMRTHPAHKPADKHFEQLNVRIFGTTGVANGMVVAKSRDGKIQRTIFTDVFACRDGKWQAVNAQETPLADSPGQ